MSTSLAELQPGAVLVIPWDGECPVLLLIRRGATPHHESCTLTVVNPGVAALPYHATDGRAPPKLKLRSCLELGGVPLARPHHALYLAYISPTSRLYLAYISPISRLYFAGAARGGGGGGEGGGGGRGGGGGGGGDAGRGAGPAGEISARYRRDVGEI